MPLRRADTCALCGNAFAPGDEAVWYREARVVTCVVCLPSPEPDVVIEPEPPAAPEIDPGVAGASARRIYERQQQRREDLAREKFGKAGVVLARIIDPPQRTTAWRKGASGEETVARRFEKHLAGTEVRLLHDRRIPGHRSNIDHIAIGPGGITVIDTKNFKGKVRLQHVGGLFSERRTILQIGGRDQTRLIKAVEGQVDVVRKVLGGTDYRDTDIKAALCCANVDGLPIFGHPVLRDVTIDGARRVSKLANRPGALDSAAIDQLWNLIGRSLPH